MENEQICSSFNDCSLDNFRENILGTLNYYSIELEYILSTYDKLQFTRRKYPLKHLVIYWDYFILLNCLMNMKFILKPQL